MKRQQGLRWCESISKWVLTIDTLAMQGIKQSEGRAPFALNRVEGSASARPAGTAVPPLAAARGPERGQKQVWTR